MKTSYVVRAAVASSTALLVLCAGTGCGRNTGGSDAEPRSEAPARESQSAGSHPFTVGALPAGFELAVAGEGKFPPSWNAETTGSTEPFTVLAPTDPGGEDDVVVVSATAYGGRGPEDFPTVGQGWGDSTELLAGDRRAVYTAPGERFGQRSWADLVVDLGDQSAVRVEKRSASAEELAVFAQRASVGTDHVVGPVVDPPPGYRVVGSVDSTVEAARGSVDSQTNTVPAPAGAHTVGWLRDEASLLVTTLPAGSVDLDAFIAAMRDRPGSWGAAQARLEERTVGGRPAAVVDLFEQEDGQRHDETFLLSSLPNGDVLVVTGLGPGLGGPSTDEVVAVAESVRSASDQEWAATVKDAPPQQPG
jgi:hypothetical protein